MQLELIRQPSVRTPLRYFGSKRRAVHVLRHYIPPAVKEMVSPFFGSGALELALTGRGIRVHGYDKFPPIGQFWRAMQRDPDGIADALRQIVRTQPLETLLAWARGRYHLEDDMVTRAAILLIIYNVSFNGMGFRGGGGTTLRRVGDTLVHISTRRADDRLIIYEQIERFYNPYFTVKTADFQFALAAHPDHFAYCDPPYPITTDCYGDAPEYHAEFPHEKLAEVLHKRPNWVLSYNDVPLIRDLYPEPDYEWRHVFWQQVSKHQGHNFGNDVVIRPRGV